MDQDPLSKLHEAEAELYQDLAADQLEIDKAREAQLSRIATFTETSREIIAELADSAAQPAPVDPPQPAPELSGDFLSLEVPQVPGTDFVANSHKALRDIVRSWQGPPDSILVVRITADMPHLYVGGYSSFSDAKSLARPDGLPLRIWFVIEDGVTVGGVSIHEKLCPVPEVRIFGGTIQRLQDHFSCVFSHERNAGLMGTPDSLIGLHDCAFQPLSDTSYGGHGSKNAVFFNPGTGTIHLTGLTTKAAEGRNVASWQEHFCYAHSPNNFLAEGCVLEGAHRTFFQLSNRFQNGTHAGDHVLRDLRLAHHGNTDVPLASADGGQAISLWGNPNGQSLVENVVIEGTALGGLGILKEGPKNTPLLNADGYSHDRVVVRGFECSQLDSAKKPIVIAESVRDLDLGSPKLSGPGKPYVFRDPIGNKSEVVASVGA